jgi:hypothetical protein
MRITIYGLIANGITCLVIMGVLRKLELEWRIITL